MLSVYLYVDVGVYVCVCVTLDAASVISGLEEKLPHTYPEKWQRALCVFFPPEEKHTPKNQTTLSQTLCDLTPVTVAHTSTYDIKRKSQRAFPVPL